MANSIEKFKVYIDQLDEVYKKASLTADLDTDGTLVKKGANANEIVIPVMEMDGLGDYSRENGYAKGSVTITNETKQFNYDRGRKFSVDAMDDEETSGLAFGKLASEFVRTKATPELDAVRFAQYFQKAGATAEGTLTSGEEVVKALRTALTKMDDAEVPEEGRILKITSTLKGLIDDLDTTKSKAVLDRFARIDIVPQSRFYTKVDLLKGTADNELEGGYKKASDGANINFMVIYPEAVLQWTKHNVNKAISPDDNQEDDSWKFFYRSYGLNEVYDQKVDGIYGHAEASV